MENRYDVVFTGRIQDGLNQEEVREKLMRLYNGNIEVIDKLLNSSRAVIKKNIDQTTAEKYKTTLEQCGLVCHIEAVAAAGRDLPPMPEQSKMNIADDSNNGLQLQTGEDDDPAAVNTVTAGPDAPAVPEKTCAECGRSFTESEMIPYHDSWICAACKPVFVQKMKEGVNLSSAMEYGGFWIRFGAKAVDGLILGGMNIIMNFAATPLLMAAPSETASPTTMMTGSLLLGLLQMVANAAYGVFFLGRFGATPGKMVCKLKVVTAEGNKITYGRAFGRFLSEFLSAILLYIGYLMAAFDSEKRALHDKICGTRVIRV
jgi:uncharacterized RDD family membrane protein YckC